VDDKDSKATLHSFKLECDAEDGNRRIDTFLAEAYQYYTDLKKKKKDDKRWAGLVLRLWRLRLLHTASHCMLECLALHRSRHVTAAAAAAAATLLTAHCEVLPT
jgi:hypothetical protein